MRPPRYVSICNPDGKRWQLYARELAAFWAEHGAAPEVEVVPWREVIPRDGDLDGLAAFDRPAVVRLESPGRDWEVTQLLLQAGARDDPAEPSRDWLSLPYQKGRLLRPGLFYRGFRRVLRGLRASFDRRPHLRPLSCPLDIAELFDKNATAARLEAADVPVPPSLPAPETADELLALVRGRRFSPAYVKLNTGSSASAIAVVHTDGEEPWCVTSAARLPDGFYSTRRLRTYRGDDLRAVLGFLLAEGACVQRGIRMARIDGMNCDLRVVVVYGRPAFTVFRLSPLPMTNLHLGGRRGDLARCRAAVPTRAWLDALDSCAEAAQLYRCAVTGVDLLFENGFLRHFVPEVNAFGDFFPGLLDDTGRSAHRIEIEETARRNDVL
jgi:hypothetical protein